ncbi:MAG: ABC transporter ATP-binding protein [Patescibacteria group bacterium]
MSEYAIEIVDFKKQYRTAKTPAIDGLSLSVKKGEFFGLLGPNGAGKSTTIHCLTGIALPTSGTMKIFGLDVVKDYREARRLVGLSPQEFNADFFTPARHLLRYVAGYYGIGPKKARVRTEELLEQFGLMNHADKPFRELSGGLKRRVMLARAMVHDPELIILDEPTSGVDVELRHDLWRYMEELNAQGKTIILTSHYLEEVEKLAKRIAIVNKGKIVAEGDKAEFMKDGDRLEQSYLKITKGEDF